LQDICDNVLYRLGGDTGPADAILLLGRTHAFPSQLARTWHINDRPETVSTARAQTRTQLGIWGVDDDTTYATEVIVSELVTNAIRYGTPPIQLRLIKDHRLTCEVHDANPAAPRRRHARTADEGGRGLFICAQIADTWGFRYDSQGKTVWTEQALQGADIGEGHP
jgi:anti-sigma regulatory factor (Ser/Thr protein kinase)